MLKKLWADLRGVKKEETKNDKIKNIISTLFVLNVSEKDMFDTVIHFDEILEIFNTYSYRSFSIYKLDNYIIKLSLDNTPNNGCSVNIWISDGIYYFQPQSGYFLVKKLILLLCDSDDICIHKHLVYSKKQSTLAPIDWCVKFFDINSKTKILI